MFLIKKFWLIILLITILFYFFINRVLAQDSQAISISPLNFDLSADPGNILSNNIRLYNSGNQLLKARITIEDFVPIGEEGNVQVFEPEPDVERAYSLARWITVEPEEIFLEPREEKNISFKIEIPKEAEPGTKHGAIVVNIGEKGGVQGGTNIFQKVCSLILLSVSGEVKESLLVKEFKGPNFQEYGPINFILKLENNGNIHLRPRGFLTITDWRNKKITELFIPQNAILPGAKRAINISWPERNIVGKFNARIIGNYGSKNIPLVASWSFWVWPWKLSLLIFIALVLLLILLIRGRKRIGAALKILFKGEQLKEKKEEKKEEITQKTTNQDNVNLSI